MEKLANALRNAKAFECYARAAEQGHAGAQGNLGMCYLEGTGVGKDAKRAVKWLRKGAENGDLPAQLTLAGCYRDGTGVRKDHEMAQEWLHKALTEAPPKGAL